MTFSALVLGSCSRRGLLLPLPGLQPADSAAAGRGHRSPWGRGLRAAGLRGCVPPVGLRQAPRDGCTRGRALWPSACELLGGKTFLAFSRNVLCGQLVAF